MGHPTSHGRLRTLLTALPGLALSLVVVLGLALGPAQSASAGREPTIANIRRKQ